MLTVLGLSQTAGRPAAIGSQRELFTDRFLIDELNGGANLRLHAPIAKEKVISFEKPWEGIYSGYITVFRDGDRFRMYYRGYPRLGTRWKPK